MAGVRNRRLGSRGTGGNRIDGCRQLVDVSGRLDDGSPLCIHAFGDRAGELLDLGGTTLHRGQVRVKRIAQAGKHRAKLCARRLIIGIAAVEQRKHRLDFTGLLAGVGGDRFPLRRTLADPLGRLFKVEQPQVQRVHVLVVGNHGFDRLQPHAHAKRRECAGGHDGQQRQHGGTADVHSGPALPGGHQTRGTDGSGNGM